MDVLLIYPDIILKNLHWPGYYYHGIGYLAAVLKKAAHKVKFLHITQPIHKREFQDKILPVGKSEVIGFSVTTNMWPYAKEWIGWSREKFAEALIIVGGVHPTLNPEEVIVADGIDAICLGEGEEALVELCDKLEKDQDITNIDNIWIKNNDKIHKNPVRSRLKNLDNLPFPDREIFDYQNLYHENMNEASVMASRGCPFRCTYCCNEALGKVFAKKALYVRFRSVQNVIQELKHIIKNFTFIKGFAFDDDVLPLNNRWFREFAGEYKKEIGLPFTCNIHPTLINEEVAKLLKEAGCWRAHMGIESGNDKIRYEILNRKISKEQIIKAFSLLKGNGIKIYSYNLIGLPEENTLEILDTIKLNALIGTDECQVSIFYPYKGTKLYDYCKTTGLLSQKVVTDYFEDTILNFSLFRRNQVLFFSSYFMGIVGLYDQLYKLPNALSKVSIKILDGLFCCQTTFKVITIFIIKIYPSIRKNRVAIIIGRPIKRLVSRVISVRGCVKLFG